MAFETALTAMADAILGRQVEFGHGQPVPATRNSASYPNPPAPRSSGIISPSHSPSVHWVDTTRCRHRHCSAKACPPWARLTA